MCTFPEQQLYALASRRNSRLDSAILNRLMDPLMSCLCMYYFYGWVCISCPSTMYNVCDFCFRGDQEFKFCNFYKTSFSYQKYIFDSQHQKKLTGDSEPPLRLRFPVSMIVGTCYGLPNQSSACQLNCI
jgi:hypothetical protein